MKQDAKDNSPKINQKNKIKFELDIRQRDDLTERQKEFIELVMDKSVKIIFCDGPAGSSKTFLSVLCGLKLLNIKALSDIIYVRSIIESASKSMGALPGQSNEKLHPFLLPLEDKLDEILCKGDIDKLMSEQRIVGMPINYLRGASYNAKFIFCDEAQNLDFKELTTLISRYGERSKMIIAGDKFQSDLNGKSGFKKMYDIFDNEISKELGIHCWQFTKEDIVRSGILKYILEAIESSVDLDKLKNNGNVKNSHPHLAADNIRDWSPAAS